MKFITEDFYVDFTSSAVVKNRDKVIRKTQQDRIKQLLLKIKKKMKKITNSYLLF